MTQIYKIKAHLLLRYAQQIDARIRKILFFLRAIFIIVPDHPKYRSWEFAENGDEGLIMNI